MTNDEAANIMIGLTREDQYKMHLERALVALRDKRVRQWRIYKDAQADGSVLYNMHIQWYE